MLVIKYHSTLATLMLIILFSKMLKNSQKKFQTQNFVKEIIESTKIFNLLKWKFQDEFIDQQIFIKVAKALLY